MPAKLKMTAKTSVDKPKIMARVAAMEKRNFQMLMMFWIGRAALIIFFPNSERLG